MKIVTAKMEAQSKKLSDVYGNSRNIPLTYQTRPNVDDRFKNEMARDKHVILHGGSKQGKTCLRKSILNESDIIVVQCTRDTTLARLYEMILKRANVEIEVLTTKTTNGTHKFAASIHGEMGIPFTTKAGADGKYEYEKGDGNAYTTKKLEIDIEDPNDILRVLKLNNSKKFIVIEDFHYLDEKIQKAFSFDLKVFHEISDFVFIIVGVWMEASRLTIYNGDLSGRVTNINVDEWTEEYLRKVINNGKLLLNIDFSTEVEDEIVKLSQDNIGLLQEICYKICEKYQVFNTQETSRIIGNKADVTEIAKKIVDDQAVRYFNFIAKFADGLSVTEFEMYKWIIYAVINSSTDDLKKGLNQAKMFNLIKPHHPKRATLQPNNLNQALQRIDSVQAKVKVQPPIFDFSNNELFVVDANFLVFLTAYTKSELLEKIGVKL